MPVTLELGGHATVLIRAGAFTLLCDPHLHDSYRGGLLGFAPARRVLPQALPRPDAVWISHSHRDHFDLASLARLDRALPVLHPDDPRIVHALRRLGFRDTTVVRDWTALTPCPGVELVWTPSTMAVPEHGLSVRTRDAFVWHMVDSLVTPAWVERLLAAGPPPDLLLAPCQPIEETRSVEGVPPGADTDWADPLTALMARARPAHVVPLPEGQYGLGDAAWLNGHKFPVPPGLVDQALRADDPDRRVLRPGPGDRLTVAGGSVRWEEGAVAWARATGEPRDRGYRPGNWIGPLAADPGAAAATVAAAAAAALDRLLDGSGPAAVPDPTGLTSRTGLTALTDLTDLAAAAPGRLRATAYRFVTVGPDAEPLAERTVRLDGDGALSPLPPECVPDIEVAVTVSDLADLLDGRLGYSAAQYGGRLREVRPGPAADPAPGPAVVTSRHDPVPATGAVMLSGTGLFALLLRARLGSALVELDRELDAWLQDRPVRPPAVARTRAVPLGSGPPSRPGPEAPPIWSRIARCLARGEDPGRASGTFTDAGRTHYLGVLGRGEWPAPVAAPDGGVGLLVLTGLVDAQPHLGGGVRFPDASYRQLLANIEASPVRRWRVPTLLPPGVKVPRWRAASLFPVPADRLRADLARRGWDGELLGPTDSPASALREAGRCWWLGVPPPDGPPGGRRALVLRESPGCRLHGLFEAGSGPEPRNTDGTAVEQPAFRVWAAPPSRLPPEDAVLHTLLRGDVRFSWLLPPRETVRKAGRAVDPVAFAERVALLALAELARRASVETAPPPAGAV
ncbi:MBL fold metallo-hydrolase [Kitasatospora sp. SUK 42]|uniref:MBL fold metallo-hydrolase n=1 Tax=Kitasatospora sp. SUK 42 TaxID=1588882 RepID=UPI0018CA7189|nr:MBL fold metallo-hydrolase [Kitasatospora sp. SUK 42]MBV2154894.1 MBL fold metallo-hydrolase [Kitasatospora sp. SUK 42]